MTRYEAVLGCDDQGCAPLQIVPHGWDRKVVIARAARQSVEAGSIGPPLVSLSAECGFAAPGPSSSSRRRTSATSGFRGSTGDDGGPAGWAADTSTALAWS